MAHPDITKVRAAHKIAKANAEHADLVLIRTLQNIAAQHTGNAYVKDRLTWEERQELFDRASDLTLKEAEVKRLEDEIAFLEDT
jgi:hypothetical protein